MNKAYKIKVLALLTGIIVMLATDYVSGRITNAFFTLPLSVLIGSLVTGFIVVKNAWVLGIALGVIYSLITITIYMVSNTSEINILQASIYPIIFYLLADTIGGLVGGFIGVRFNVNA